MRDELKKLIVDAIVARVTRRSIQQLNDTGECGDFGQMMHEETEDVFKELKDWLNERSDEMPSERMPCSITDGEQYDDQFDGDEEPFDEFKCSACQKVPVKHPGLCEECRTCHAESLYDSTRRH